MLTGGYKAQIRGVKDPDERKLAMAAMGNKVNVLKQLLSKPNLNPAANNNLALLLAAESGHKEVVELLLKDKRVDPAADNNFAMRAAVEGGHKDLLKLLLQHMFSEPEFENNLLILLAAKHGNADVVKLLLDDNRVNPAARNNAAIFLAAENGHTEVVRLFMSDKRINHATVFRIAVENGNKDLVKLLLETGRVNPAVGDNKLISIAVEKGHSEVVELLLKDNRVDPAVGDNKLINIAAEKGHIEVVKLLLKDSRVNPAVGDNKPISIAAEKGHSEVVKLLLKDNRVNPAAGNYQAIRVAATKEIAELLLEHTKFHDLPLSEIIDVHALNVKEIGKFCVQFVANPSQYLDEKSNIKLSPAQIAALRIILLREEIDKMEESEKQRIAHDVESAMRGSAVVSANNTFENIVKPNFEKQFMAYIDPNEPDPAKAKMQAICAIEEQIRGLILEEIEKNSQDPQLSFIKKNKEELMKGTNKALMAQALTYFNSLTDPSHAAWRGYDPNAPSEGYANLLTEPTKGGRLIGVAEQPRGTTMGASNVIRERVAYYYLLVRDKHEKVTQEDISNRVTNFISELSDLRRAHSQDHPGKPDAPSCYPGYLGRIANLGYGHPLTQKMVTKKMLIKETMRPIILEEFKKTLANEQGKDNCEKVLNSLSNLSEKLQTDQRIFTKKEQYSDELLEIRRKFTDSFHLDTVYKQVNDELESVGSSPMDDQEQKYVVQCILDPCRDKMMGPVGDVYRKHIETTYAPELAESKKQEQMELELLKLSKIENPYQSKYNLVAKLPNPGLRANQLIIAEKKLNNFNKLAEFLLKNFTMGEITQNQMKGIMLLVQAMTEVAFNKDRNLRIDNNNVKVICEKLFKNGEDSYREVLNEEVSGINQPGSDTIPELLDTIDKYYLQDLPQKRLEV